MIYLTDLENKLIIESLLILEINLQEYALDSLYKLEITRKLRHTFEREVAVIALRKS